MLPALAFLPGSDVIEGFEELVDTMRVLYDDVAAYALLVHDLLQHFEDTYIGRSDFCDQTCPHVIFEIRRVFVCMELSSKLELIYILYN